MKAQQSLSDLVNHAIASLELIDQRLPNISSKLKLSFNKENECNTYETEDFEQIKRFWNMCLQNLKENSEYPSVVVENDSLLAEAKELRRELVGRIKTTIET